MIAIIDYGLGNLASVKNAFEVLGKECEITNDITKIRKADRLVLPGVGAFGSGMANLKRLNLIDVLNEEVVKNKKPFLGICLGMQLICKKSYEGGEFNGLGWIDANVVHFDIGNKRLLVPHVGWNDVECNLGSLIFEGGSPQQTFYFVHSYYVQAKDKDIVVGWCDYGIRFPAAIQKDNMFAVQFHPEKSQTEGLEILRKFSNI